MPHAPLIVSMSPPGYSSARLRPRRAGLRFTRCTQVTNGPVPRQVSFGNRHNFSSTPLDSKIEENAQKPEYAKKVERYQTLRGVKTVTAMTIVAEVWDMRRYGTAPQFMGSTGEHSTGDHERRGKITKAGNAHLRRVLVEAAWQYRHRASASKAIKSRRKAQPSEVVSIAERADQRLNHKFRRMVDRYNKKPGTAAVAVARELAGFIWAIGQIQG